MPAIVIVGAQWGDEGKGKIVDIYTERADMVVRFGGGPNAGHTLVVGKDKLVVRLVPSGILRADTTCVLAQGMVIDPRSLVTELDELEGRGIVTKGRLLVSDRAHVILPYHVLVDGLREGKKNAIGTTKRGVGPCYEDKVARRGVPLGAFRDVTRLRELIGRAIADWTPVIEALGGDKAPSVDEILAAIEPTRARILPMLVDSQALVEAAVRGKKKVVLEGAQGTLLDVDHGTYPFVTSSTPTAGGACVGAGIGPTRIDEVVGLVKAYTTRVGGGPFPTELHDAVGEQIRKVGAEFGSVTGRPRRTGWLDLPALRYAVRVNGLDALAITKLDVLTGLDEVKVCVAYETKHGRTTSLPMDELDTVTPVYRAFPGWKQNLASARAMGDLPAEARAYLEFVEKEAECPFILVSVGPGRDETIVLRDPFVS
ncbi:MAG: adenylosuccinate synthetase [Labilithrix sp.]|nr:adenylosuccinate synthetase [Labilithrix sp.]